MFFLSSCHEYFIRDISQVPQQGGEMPVVRTCSSPRDETRRAKCLLGSALLVLLLSGCGSNQYYWSLNVSETLLLDGITKNIDDNVLLPLPTTRSAQGWGVAPNGDLVIIVRDRLFLIDTDRLKASEHRKGSEESLTEVSIQDYTGGTRPLALGRNEFIFGGSETLHRFDYRGQQLGTISRALAPAWLGVVSDRYVLLEEGAESDRLVWVTRDGAEEATAELPGKLAPYFVTGIQRAAIVLADKVGVVIPGDAPLVAWYDSRGKEIGRGAIEHAMEFPEIRKRVGEDVAYTYDSGWDRNVQEMGGGIWELRPGVSPRRVAKRNCDQDAVGRDRCSLRIVGFPREAFVAMQYTHDRRELGFDERYGRVELYDDQGTVVSELVVTAPGTHALIAIEAP